MRSYTRKTLTIFQIKLRENRKQNGNFISRYVTTFLIPDDNINKCRTDRWKCIYFSNGEQKYRHDRKESSIGHIDASATPEKQFVSDISTDGRNPYLTDPFHLFLSLANVANGARVCLLQQALRPGKNVHSLFLSFISNR